ncbi:MAG: protein translocase subunit SecD [Saezia sp.]
MNRYPMWKYALIVFAVVFGVLYSSPTLLSGVFGFAPIVLIAQPKAERMNPELENTVRNELKQIGIEPTLVQVNPNNLTLRFASEDDQKLARPALELALNPAGGRNEYIVSGNKQALTPRWLTAIGAKPVNLGLDLRGGVHFLLQVDMDSAIGDRLDGIHKGIEDDLNGKGVLFSSMSRKGQQIEAVFASETNRASAVSLVRASQGYEVDIQEVQAEDGGYKLLVRLTDATIKQIQDRALQQNIETLHKRINALGIAEPVIQQQGVNRIVVQLPGEGDITKAKSVIGRTATLQIRLVDERVDPRLLIARGEILPPESELFYESNGAPILLYRQVHLTGENLIDAQPGRDDQKGIPAVMLRFDSKGSAIFYDLTLKNKDRRLAIVLFEEGVGRVVTAPVIMGPIPGGKVQISGSMTYNEAADISLLLRSGSLAAPMHIIEERVIGPSLGEENIERGVNSVVYGFLAVAAFMCLYYMLFGVFSTVSMFVNLLLLVSVLSLLQATLTLPGIAAMALALGISIDSNVLINERIREELRTGVTPQMAITAGYEHAWRTILDSNVTSMIAGIALLTCDAGPIRGFAIVHILGILTSLFSSVFVSRGIVNLWYGNRRKLQKLAIGQVWKPEAN